MKKLFAAIQVLFLICSVCACTEETVTDIRNLLPEKKVIEQSPTDRGVYTSAEQLIEGSDCIIEGIVLDEGTVYHSSDIYAEDEPDMTYFKVGIQSILKGEDLPRDILIVQRGTSPDTGEVKYKKGEHIISFLRQLENDIPGAEESPYRYMSIGCEDANFRVVEVEYNGKPVSVVQCFSADNMLQYDGKSLSDFLQLLK